MRGIEVRVALQLDIWGLEAYSRSCVCVCVCSESDPQSANDLCIERTWPLTSHDAWSSQTQCAWETAYYINQQLVTDRPSAELDGLAAGGVFRIFVGESLSAMCLLLSVS